MPETYKIDGNNMKDEELEQSVREVLSSILKGKQVEAKIQVLNCLQPGRPNPTYRYDYVV